MKKRMAKLYEIAFLDEQDIQTELSTLLRQDVDILKETRYALLVSAYSIEDRRRLSNRLFKEHQKVHVQKEDLLWTYFPPELTTFNQTKFRCFSVKEVIHQKDRITLFVQLAYEKQRNWFDTKLL
ncbi:hypothetical protein ACFC9R_13700 [Enterococcus casseliflavus]